MLALDLLSTLVHKLRKATEREERFAFLDVRERLLKLFGELIREEGEKAEDGFYRIGKRTQKELAIKNRRFTRGDLADPQGPCFRKDNHGEGHFFSDSTFRIYRRL